MAKNLSLMDQEIEKIKKDVPAVKDLSEDKLFDLVCFKYFYNNGIFQYTDYRTIFTDGKDDGGIDFITTFEPDNMQTNVVYAQCKYYDTPKSKRDYIPDFCKMHTTINDFKINNNVSDYNTNLQRIMANNLDSAKEEGWAEELAYFIYSDIDSERDLEIKNEIEKSKAQSQDLRDYEINFYSKNDIDSQIESFISGRTSVPQDKIRLYSDEKGKTNIIKYKDKGLLTSISAQDLKRLYLRHRYEGLFEQNLRYFRINKKIDNKIINSINKKRENFWYFNNGIIIACSDFHLDGGFIKLWDFSIVNGGQTTVLIGDYLNGTGDMAIPCKIIKDKNPEFLAEVAEASNSQKAISDADLKANNPEQKQLKKKLETQQIYLEIKKGKVGNKKAKNINDPQGYNKETWDKLSNEEFGQLILAFLKQKPGSARSGKKNIFSSEKTYNSLFKPKEGYDPVFVKSLIKLFNLIKDFETKIGSNNIYGEDIETTEILKYGKFFILAIIGFLYKELNNKIDFNMRKDDDLWEQELEKGNFVGSIFKDNLPDDYEETLNSLLQEIVLILKQAHMKEQLKEQNSTYTNFFKTNPKYRKWMIQEIIENILKIQTNNKRWKETYLETLFNCNN